MTVSSEINEIFHDIVSVLTVYPYNFKIYDTSHLEVYDQDPVTGVVVKRTEGVDYSVSITPLPGVGGNVTFVVAPTVGHIVALIRTVPYLQETAYPENGPFPSESVETTEDLNTMMCQRLQETLGRAFRVQKGDEALNEEIPVAALRANKILAFDVNGEPDVTENVGVNRGDWLTATTYQARDIVISVDPATEGNAYTASETHTSGVFATDLAAGKWKILFDLQTAIAQVDLEAVVKGEYQYALTTGSSTAYEATLPVTINSYNDGMEINLKIHATNTAAATVDVNSIGAVGLKRADGTDFYIGELVIGRVYKFIAIGGVFRLFDYQAGEVIQQVRHSDGVYQVFTSPNNVIPFDNTIPQQTEGAELITLAITPKSATSILEINVVINIAPSVAVATTAAIFRDAVANALCCNFYDVDTANEGSALSFRHSVVSGSVAATTFKVRGGVEVSGHNLNFNGLGGAAKFGGTLLSSITITEYAS